MKPKPIKLLQDFRELHRPPGNGVLPKSDGLYLMRLRSRFIAPRPFKRSVAIPVLFKGGDQTHAEAVKITHLRRG